MDCCPESKSKGHYATHDVVSHFPWNEHLNVGLYVHVENDTLRYQCLLHVVKELNEGFPSSQCSGLIKMDEIILL